MPQVLRPGLEGFWIELPLVSQLDERVPERMGVEVGRTRKLARVTEGISDRICVCPRHLIDANRSKCEIDALPPCAITAATAHDATAERIPKIQRARLVLALGAHKRVHRIPRPTIAKIGFPRPSCSSRRLLSIRFSSLESLFAPPSRQGVDCGVTTCNAQAVHCGNLRRPNGRRTKPIVGGLKVSGATPAQKACQHDMRSSLPFLMPKPTFTAKSGTSA